MEQNTLIRRGLGLRGVDFDKVSPGYALYVHLTSPGTVRLVSNDGTEVHRWVCSPASHSPFIDELIFCRTCHTVQVVMPEFYPMEISLTMVFTLMLPDFTQCGRRFVFNEGGGRELELTAL